MTRICDFGSGFGVGLVRVQIAALVEEQRRDVGGGEKVEGFGRCAPFWRSWGGWGRG